MVDTQMENDSWKTKPTDRFVLKWIKLNLSARITPRLLVWPWLSPWQITLSSALLGSLALIGCNLISYSSARAETLGLELGPPTLASKGTLTSVVILCAFFSFIWSGLPIVALFYLVIHPNGTVFFRLLKTRE